VDASEPWLAGVFSKNHGDASLIRLYVSKHGVHIHADVNAAYNILRKACPDAFTRKGIPVKLYPRRIDIDIHENRKTSPDIFGWNGAGARHHPQLFSNPAPS